MLELVGIVRDKAKEVVIDKDTLDFYSAQSEHLNNDFHIGETVVVTRPCWKINGHPARKGEIAKRKHRLRNSAVRKYHRLKLCCEKTAVLTGMLIFPLRRTISVHTTVIYLM